MVAWPPCITALGNPGCRNARRPGPGRQACRSKVVPGSATPVLEQRRRHQGIAHGGRKSSKLAPLMLHEVTACIPRGHDLAHDSIAWKTVRRRSGDRGMAHDENKLVDFFPSHRCPVKVERTPRVTNILSISCNECIKVAVGRSSAADGTVPNAGPVSSSSCHPVGEVTIRVIIGGCLWTCSTADDLDTASVHASAMLPGRLFFQGPALPLRELTPFTWAAGVASDRDLGQGSWGKLDLAASTQELFRVRLLPYSSTGISLTSTVHHVQMPLRVTLLGPGRSVVQVGLVPVLLYGPACSRGQAGSETDTLKGPGAAWVPWLQRNSPHVQW
ncbi:unnamed protein product [Symbiodinium sp. CCMP2456]|nr:unnamed protein product [Symbiodinium sp. CCMP2456]